MGLQVPDDSLYSLVLGLHASQVKEGAMYQTSVGLLDGNDMIEMNNLSVGYFPSESPEIGIYPPPVPNQSPFTPVEPAPSLETNF